MQQLTHLGVYNTLPPFVSTLPKTRLQSLLLLQKSPPPYSITTLISFSMLLQVNKLFLDVITNLSPVIYFTHTHTHTQPVKKKRKGDKRPSRDLEKRNDSDTACHRREDGRLWARPALEVFVSSHTQKGTHNPTAIFSLHRPW